MFMFFAVMGAQDRVYRLYYLCVQSKFTLQLQTLSYNFYILVYTL